MWRGKVCHLKLWFFPKLKYNCFLMLCQFLVNSKVIQVHPCVCLRAQSFSRVRLTLRDPLLCSPPGSSVHGISQARKQEWVAIFSSRGSSRPRDQTHVSLASGFFTLSHLGSPVYRHIHRHVYTYIYTLYIFFYIFFSIMAYYKILNIVPYAIQ